jgi:essential nuclear protein 1
MIEQDYDDEDEGDEEGHVPMVRFEGEYVTTEDIDMSEEEDAIVQRFLGANRNESRTLADIIMEKIREKEIEAEAETALPAASAIPPKVIEVYTAVGKLLKHYKSGKLPKALKMLPHLKNWEDVLWLTRPDEWSAGATYACTRIFASNLNAKMAQRFYNMILLEKCRDDIRSNMKLNYHLYMALKKALFKPAAFFKGVILPLAQSLSCTLREAIIFGSVLAKVSIQGNHSAAALLRLIEMPYSAATSVFLKILLNKKHALPRRVIDALVHHFASFTSESRQLPVSSIQSFCELIIIIVD